MDRVPRSRLRRQLPHPKQKPSRCTVAIVCVACVSFLTAVASVFLFWSARPTVVKTLSFPPGFMWGTATASYQIEGAANTDRVPSIWDRFTRTPGKILHNQNADVSVDHYNRFKKDVQLMAHLNTTHYRFSIAWPRMQTFADPANPKPNPTGIAFYNALIDELLANGITPVVTLYHWDLPVAVQDAFGGWAGDGAVVPAYQRYATLCFKEFGDRVKQWITFNEPWCSAVLGYDLGAHAPGDTSAPGKKLYRAGHNLLLSHGRAVHIYRKDFQPTQKGSIGITLNSNWAEPKNRNDPKSVAAAKREMDFWLGWYADPIWKGDYPAVMKETLKERLPSFTEEEKAMLKGSSDFFGVNHYSSGLIEPMVGVDRLKTPYWQDKATVESYDWRWKKTDMGWSIVPWGFQKLLLYIHEQYQPEGGIIVTENGLATREDSVKAMQKDTLRVEYLSSYLHAMHQAMEQGADVRGYFLWSLMDNFEWAFGFTKRFGLYYVDYETLERTPKPAAKWYANVTGNNALVVEVEI